MFIGIIPITDARTAGAIKAGATLYYRGKGREWRMLTPEERRRHVLDGVDFEPGRYGVHEDWRNEVEF